uniref:Uncharacterized protein n=1 Tax=Glossina palpalis gambiensis TaxID=67801 RepID=A0A1B0BU10_9MUSC
MECCNEQADLGQMFVAINPNCFDPDFEINMCDLNSRLLNSKPECTECSLIYCTCASTTTKRLPMISGNLLCRSCFWCAATIIIIKRHLNVANKV